MQSINIINLIETSPIAKLTNINNDKLLTKIKENFTEMEQQLFVLLSYYYLNHTQNTDYVIDLDNVWRWLGFSVKAKAKTLLEKYFTLNIDYKNFLYDIVDKDLDEKKHGGHNKETIILTIKTFKLFCMKADTKKSKEIHEYFIKLEEILYNIIQEENDELKIKLKNIKNEINKSLNKNTNIKHFNDIDSEKLQTEIDTLKQIITLSTSSNPIQNDNVFILIQELLNGQKELLLEQKEMMKQIQSLEKTNKEILEKINSSQTKNTTNFNQPLPTLGPRLQKINPESMTLNKVYDSIAECIKEYNFKVKRPSIMKAASENTIYSGFRWAFVDRNDDPNIIANIEITKPTKIQNIGYIAKLNSNQTEILNIYLDRKTAAISNDYKSDSSIDNYVKNMTITKGYYYVLYNKCSTELKNKFVEKYGEPLLYKDGIGQFNSENILIKEFICKYDCIKQLKISDKTLRKALNKNILYNNFYFKNIGSKIKYIE